MTILGVTAGLSPFPLIIEAPRDHRDLALWADGREQSLRSTLLGTGAILFRGFAVDSVETFERFASLFISDHFDYTFALTPRTKVSAKIVTSTEYPSSLVLPLHSECCAHRDWPMLLMFYCHLAPSNAGETPIADNRRVYEALPGSIRDRFEQAGVLYVRQIPDDNELERTFGTADRAVIEKLCTENRYELSETDGSGYDIRWHAPALARHPDTGETVWFNHLQTFHQRAAHHLSGRRSPVDSPGLSSWKVYYGDGSPIENRVMHEIRRVYRSEMTTFPWMNGDILMIDNMLTSHGRNSFTGPREILLAMGESYRRRVNEDS